MGKAAMTDGAAGLYRENEEVNGPTLEGFWLYVLKPTLWGVGIMTLLAVYIPAVVRAYWEGYRTFENTVLKPLAETGERFLTLFGGEFSDHYLIGTIVVGILLSFYVKFIFSEEA